MHKKSFLLPVVMFFFLTGCAVTNYTMPAPSYQPSFNKIESSGKYAIFTKIDYQPVFQNEPKAIGVKKNGYGQEMARIYLSENIEDWLKKSFEQELKAAGFNVVDTRKNEVVNMTLNVRQLFVEPWVGFWSADVIGILKIEVKVEVPDKDSYYIRKFVTYDKLTTIAWPDFVFETRIANLVQRTIPEIVKETILLLAKIS
jgi:uncharacterized lipoprotein YajG